MQIKLSFVLTSFFAGVALASPWQPYQPAPTKTVTVTVTPTATTISQCNTGNVQCCNTVQSANSPSVVKQLGLLGVALQGVDLLVGLGCTPIGVLTGNTCTQQAVCCNNVQFNGLINIGCSPIIL